MTSTKKRVGYLGPPGTFSEQVVQREPDLAAGELVPFPLMTEILFAVAEGTLDVGVVPVENAIEGTVNAIIDTLAFDVDVLIQREMLEPVSLDLLTQPGADLSKIEHVLAIPVAAAQCRAWMRDNLGTVELIAANSNAEAAQVAAAKGDPTVAAIANSRAGQIYGLESAASEIEDHPGNTTRFVAITSDGVPTPTGNDKTSIVVFQRADEPGSLLAILQEFAARNINLSLLLSRPTKTSLGEYCFILDLDGHIADPVVADCLRNLRAKQGGVKFLGSYPAAGNGGHEARLQATAEMASAQQWVESIQAQIES
ncbi:MAG: prephenate dehydratase [Microthrixaceae bacterium]